MTHLMSATTSRANLNGEEGANIRMEEIEAVLYINTVYESLQLVFI